MVWHVFSSVYTVSFFFVLVCQCGHCLDCVGSNLFARSPGIPSIRPVSCPLWEPSPSRPIWYYCRLGDLLCFVFMSAYWPYSPTQENWISSVRCHIAYSFYWTVWMSITGVAQCLGRRMVTKAPENEKISAWRGVLGIEIIK